MLFADLRLAEPILRSLVEQEYATATPIQAGAIPPAMAGQDILGCAATGTGKTAAFALPILHRLAEKARPLNAKGPRCLVLCPTRELATQIADGFRTYGKHLRLRIAVIFGGVNQRPQVDALRHGAEIVVATPGRFLDLMRQGHVDLSNIESLVLDEADRMLDMGFIHDIRAVVAATPATRQTLLFSATMPQEIRRLSAALLRNPAEIHVAAEPSKGVAGSGELIEQWVYHVEKLHKSRLLAHLHESLPMARTIVFTRTKHGADKVVSQLHSLGVRAEAIHGNKSQNARQRALANFKAGKVSMMVATDIASRGIDVDQVTHVVNYDVTHEPETYMHRIGRTGRAGATGAALSFVNREEQSNLRAIERMIGRKLPVRESGMAMEVTLPAQPESRPADNDRANDRSKDRDGDARPQRPAHDPRGNHRGRPGKPHTGHIHTLRRPAAPAPSAAHAIKPPAHTIKPAAHAPAATAKPHTPHTPSAPKSLVSPGKPKSNDRRPTWQPPARGGRPQSNNSARRPTFATRGGGGRGR